MKQSPLQPRTHTYTHNYVYNYLSATFHYNVELGTAHPHSHKQILFVAMKLNWIFNSSKIIIFEVKKLQYKPNRTEPSRKSRNCSLCAYVQQRVEHVDIWTAFVFFLFLVCFFYFNHSFFYSSTHIHPHSLFFILVYIFFFLPFSHYIRTHFRSFVWFLCLFYSCNIPSWPLLNLIVLWVDILDVVDLHFIVLHQVNHTTSYLDDFLVLYLILSHTQSHIHRHMNSLETMRR